MRGVLRLQAVEGGVQRGERGHVRVRRRAFLQLPVIDLRWGVLCWGVCVCIVVSRLVRAQ